VELQRERHNVCTHLEVEVVKIHLEVDLMTPKYYAFGDLGCYALVVSKIILQKDRRYSKV